MTCGRGPKGLRQAKDVGRIEHRGWAIRYRQGAMTSRMLHDAMSYIHRRPGECAEGCRERGRRGKDGDLEQKVPAAWAVMRRQGRQHPRDLAKDLRQPLVESRNRDRSKIYSEGNDSFIEYAIMRGCQRRKLVDAGGTCPYNISGPKGLQPNRLALF